MPIILIPHGSSRSFHSLSTSFYRIRDDDNKGSSYSDDVGDDAKLDPDSTILWSIFSLAENVRDLFYAFLIRGGCSIKNNHNYQLKKIFFILNISVVVFFKVVTITRNTLVTPWFFFPVFKDLLKYILFLFYFKEDLGSLHFRHW